MKQVSVRSVLSGAPICKLCCFISVLLGGIVPYLISVTVENSSLNTTCN